MAEEEKTMAKINSAMKTLSRGDKLKEEMALIVGPNASWEEFLTPAPMCICLLGELMVISTRADFSLEQTPPKDGFKLMRWPNSFRASLVQITNSGWRAFNEADKTMDQVRLMTAQVPGHLKDAIKILLQGEDEDLEDLLPIKLSAIQGIAHKCVTLASSVEKRFEEVMDLAGEILESSTSAKGTYEDKLKDVEAELAVATKNRETAEERKKLSEDQYKKLQRAVDKAEKDYEKAMDSMPSGWTMIGMNTVEGMSNAFTTLLSGVGRLATLGLGTSGGEDRSLAEKAASKLLSRKATNEKPLDEKTIDAYTKVPQLKGYADSLKMTCIEDNKLKANVAQSEDNIRYLLAQFKHISQEVGIKGNNNVQNHLIALSDEGMQICTQLKELSKAMDQEEADRGMAQRIIAFHEKVLVLQLEGTAILGSCPTESKAPNQSVLPQAQDTTKSAAQQTVENARFKIEASTAHLDSTKERYDNSCDKLIENTEKLGHIIATIAKLDIHKIDFQQIRETLIKGIRALGELREQWTKLVRFFQMMSNIIRCSMSTSLTDFTTMTEKAKQRKQAIEGYTLSQMKKDMIYKQAFEAAKIAHLVNMISSAYVDVSNRYIMSKVAGLGKLQGYDADSEKDRNAIKREFDALVEGCKDAQEGIKDIVLEHKREFDRRIESRIKTIKTELNAALPPPLPSDKSGAKIKEVVKKAMDTVNEVVPTATKGLDPDDFC